MIDDEWIKRLRARFATPVWDQSGKRVDVIVTELLDEIVHLKAVSSWLWSKATKREG